MLEEGSQWGAHVRTRRHRRLAAKSSGNAHRGEAREERQQSSQSHVPVEAEEDVDAVRSSSE